MASNRRLHTIAAPLHFFSHTNHPAEAQPTTARNTNIRSVAALFLILLFLPDCDCTAYFVCMASCRLSGVVWCGELASARRVPAQVIMMMTTMMMMVASETASETQPSFQSARNDRPVSTRTSSKAVHEEVLIADRIRKCCKDRSKK